MADIAKDRIEHIREDVRQGAGKVEKEATRMADQAGEWFSQNSGRVYLAVGVAAVAGLIGYFIARRSESYYDRSPL